MALDKVTVNTHTKGKNSQPFSYVAVGKIVNVETTDRETKEVTVTPTLVSDGMVKEQDEAVNYFYSLHSDKTPEQQKQEFVDAIVREANREARRQASPTTEVDKTDELTPIIEKLVAGGFLSADPAVIGSWRRTVTSSAKGMDETRLAIAARMKEYRAAVKAGISF